MTIINVVVAVAVYPVDSNRGAMCSVCGTPAKEISIAGAWCGRRLECAGPRILMISRSQPNKIVWDDESPQ